MFDLKEFGQMVKAIRKQRKMSQTEFGEVVGLSPSYISKIEKAKAKPTLEAIEQIAKKLDINIKIFLITNGTVRYKMNERRYSFCT